MLQLEILRQAPRILIAFSGGLDSHVLLHQLCHHHAIDTVKLLAVHCQHQLHTDSQQWARHCAAICQQLNIAFHCVSLDFDRHSNIEANARTARYQALSALMQPGDVLLTAHHRNDQAETVLLQLFRGAGIKGLSAISVSQNFSQGLLIRPLLDNTRNELVAYAQQHQLQWIEDTSNQDIKLRRNFLRHKVLPLLTSYWPKIINNISRTAQHCQTTQILLDELANIDYENSYQRLHQQSSLDLHYMAKLNPARQKNLLRHALQPCFPLPDHKQLDELLRVMLTAANDQQPIFRYANVEFRRFQNRLYFFQSLICIEPPLMISWDLLHPLTINADITVSPKDIAQLDQSKLYQTCTIQFRQGGERFHPADRNHSQSLKKLMQAWHIPPWLRNRTPLLYHGDQLIVVVGYAIHKDFIRC